MTTSATAASSGSTAARRAALAPESAPGGERREVEERELERLVGAAPGSSAHARRSAVQAASAARPASAARAAGRGGKQRARGRRARRRPRTAHAPMAATAGRPAKNPPLAKASTSGSSSRPASTAVSAVTAHGGRQRSAADSLARLPRVGRAASPSIPLGLALLAFAWASLQRPGDGRRRHEGRPLRRRRARSSADVLSVWIADRVDLGHVFGGPVQRLRVADGAVLRARRRCSGCPRG